MVCGYSLVKIGMRYKEVKMVKYDKSFLEKKPSKTELKLFKQKRKLDLLKAKHKRFQKKHALILKG